MKNGVHLTVHVARKMICIQRALYCDSKHPFQWPAIVPRKYHPAAGQHVISPFPDGIFWGLLLCCSLSDLPVRQHAFGGVNFYWGHKSARPSLTCDMESQFSSSEPWSSTTQLDNSIVGAHRHLRIPQILLIDARELRDAKEDFAARQCK
jgi:hypothetical protein